jgi:hypothetical protein
MANYHGVAHDEDKPSGPSRADIETLCLLYAVGVAGRTAEELAHRLGLAAGLAGAVGEAAGTLIDGGWLEAHGDRFVLTVEGRNHLVRRLAGLGVSVSNAGG